MEISTNDSNVVASLRSTVTSSNRCCCSGLFQTQTTVLASITILGFLIVVQQNSQILQSTTTTTLENLEGTVVPFCNSGNHYLSLQHGGKWVDTGKIKEGYDPATIPANAHMWFFCYQHEGYSDTFEWQPPCRPFPLPTTTSTSSRSPFNETKNNTNNTNTGKGEEVDEEKQPQQHHPHVPVKVLLWGDSLTNQIYSSTKYKANAPGAAASIQYKFVQNREPYIIPSVHPFRSKRHPHCARVVNSNPTAFYLKNFSSETDFVESIFGNAATTAPTFDYIFFNTFPHYAKMHSMLWDGCYNQQINNNKEKTDIEENMREDLLQYYETELDFICRLVKEYFPNTRFYFRTSSPQVYAWVPAYRPLDDVPPAPASKECITNPSKYMWKCAYATNEIAKRVFTKYGHTILDTGPIMSMRVDAHPCSNIFNLQILPMSHGTGVRSIAIIFVHLVLPMSCWRPLKQKWRPGKRKNECQNKNKGQ